MNQRQTIKIFLSSRMDDPGKPNHSYRQALINLIEREYPFLQVNAFEDTANPENFRSWEIDAIKDAALFIALIIEDREEIIFEIEQAISAKNPALLFFFPNEKKAQKTWNRFALLQGIKVSRVPTWRDLIQSIKDSIDSHIIKLLIGKKALVSYDPRQPMEKI